MEGSNSHGFGNVLNISNIIVSFYVRLTLLCSFGHFTASQRLVVQRRLYLRSDVRAPCLESLTPRPRDVIVIRQFYGTRLPSSRCTRSPQRATTILRLSVC